MSDIPVDAVHTPELDKMLKVIPERLTQEVGAFLDWLAHSEFAICKMSTDKYGDAFYDPQFRTPQQWLAKMHGIDLAKIEEERMLLLQRQRLHNLAQRLEEME